MIPVGSILPYAGEITAASKARLQADGYLFCDGAYYKASDYPELYEIVKDLYGDKRTAFGYEEFCVPDYRGLFLRGADMGRKLDPDRSSRAGHLGNTANTGDKVGSRQNFATEKHRHRVGYTTPNYPELLKKLGKDLEDEKAQAKEREKNPSILPHMTPGFNSVFGSRLQNLERLYKLAIVAQRILTVAFNYAFSGGTKPDIDKASEVALDNAVRPAGLVMTQYSLSVAAEKKWPFFHQMDRLPQILAADLKTEKEGSSDETRPANVYVNYIICFESFPAHDK